MFESNPDRGSPSALRGWLSEIYFPALLDPEMRDQSIEALALRLGPKASLHDPLVGHATGVPAIVEHLKKTANWLVEHAASYARLSFTTGVDRDVTEGTLSLTFASKTIGLPVAVVAERRRSREVELRLYFSTQLVGETGAVRKPLVPVSAELLPQVVTDHLDAMTKGDVRAVLACFQVDGLLRESRGTEHAQAGGGLEAYYKKLFAGGAVGGGLEMQRGGSADDGRICSVEYTLTKVGGRDVPPQAGLMMYERGESGLLRAVRVYDDVET